MSSHLGSSSCLQLGKGLLRLLPERLRDVLVAWWLGPRVQPLQLKKHNTAAEVCSGGHTAFVSSVKLYCMAPC